MKREVTAEELARPTIPYTEARATILAAFAPLPPADVPLHDALGLVIAEPVVADQDVPAFASSAMDGYAVRATDAGAPLRIVGDVPAGTADLPMVEPGTAAVIMTGGPIPPGADTVVPWEDTDRDGDVVRIVGTVRPGQHVRPQGEDVARGAEVIAAGTVLRAVHLGVLASLGRTHARAHPCPRVALLSSGDEVVEPGTPLAPGQVYDANRTLLTAMCAEAGADVVAADLLPDDPSALRAWLYRWAAECDLIVTTGGASVGEHDWMRQILEAEGDLKLWRVAMKPGKPVAFARIAGTPVLTLPGNPGSAFTGTHVFVQPAIRIMAAREPDPPRVRARLGAAVRNGGRTLFCRVRLEGDVAHPLPAQSSVVLSNLIPADGYAIVEPGGMSEGAEVSVELIWQLLMQREG